MILHRIIIKNHFRDKNLSVSYMSRTKYILSSYQFIDFFILHYTKKIMCPNCKHLNIVVQIIHLQKILTKTELDKTQTK